MDIASASDEFGDLLYDPATLYLTPLTEADAEVLIEHYEQERNVTFDSQSKRRLVRYGSTWPRLLKNACDVAREGKVDLKADCRDAVQQLLSDRRIRSTCCKIWSGLSDEDQNDLRLVLAGTPVPEDSSPLMRYGLVTVDHHGQPQVFSSVFEAFVQKHERIVPLLRLIPPNKVQRGIEIILLTPLEYRFLECLFEKPSIVRTYDEIIEHVYVDAKVKEGVTSQALATLATRLRKKINPPGHNYIDNVRGVGYDINGGPGTAGKPR
jgi:DNA-binding winged helix-turn-helix (wHTH) protein